MAAALCPGAGAAPLAPIDGVGVELAVDIAAAAAAACAMPPDEVSIGPPGRLLRSFSSRRHLARRFENQT